MILSDEQVARDHDISSGGGGEQAALSGKVFPFTGFTIKLVAPRHAVVPGGLSEAERTFGILEE
jgi:hypothetical protein